MLDADARAWVAEVCGSDVVASGPLGSGARSVVDRVDLADGRAVVLRRVLANPEDPTLDPAQDVRTEATALRLLDGAPWAPVLFATDPDGARCGSAASIQSLLPGRLEAGLDRLRVDVLARAIHLVAAVTAAPAGLPTFDPWLRWDVPEPAWLGDGVWARTREVLSAWRPTGERLIHRDLHPGNVLTHEGGLGGLIDWSDARSGPTEADISRCRVELAVLAGQDAADELLDQCSDLVDDYDVRWDVLVAAELAPQAETVVGFNEVGAQLTVEDVRRSLARTVTTALAQL